MIEYVLAHSPDDRVLKKASALLKKGEIVCLPSDTSWVLLADPYAKGATDKLYKFKGEDIHKHFSVFCKDISMANEIAKIDNNAFKILKRNIPGNFTFIFEATKKIAKTLPASKIDKEIGIRFVPSILIEKLLDIHGDIVITTQIPHERLGVESQTEIYSYMLEDYLKNIASMIIDPGEFEFLGQSTIVSFLSDQPELIRAGNKEIFDL